MAPIRPSRKVRQLSAPPAQDRISEPATPNAAASLGVAGTARGADGDVLRVTDYGVDPTGEEPISEALRSLPIDDGDTVFFPEGRYLMDDWFRYTGFGELEVVGDDATIVPSDDYPHNWLFKLGVPDDPGSRLSIRGFDFDFTAPDTGLRALQTHVDDKLSVENVDVEYLDTLEA